jgi:hypothetical protein
MPVSRRRGLAISDLLNPATAAAPHVSSGELVDVRTELKALARISRILASSSTLVPSPVKDNLSQAVQYLTNTVQTNRALNPLTPSTQGSGNPVPAPSTQGNTTLPPSLRPPVFVPPFVQPRIDIHHQVVLNRKTTLKILYVYGLHSFIEYPETSNLGEGPIGHLFRVDPSDWKNPTLNFAYALGPPKGTSAKGAQIYCPLLVDKHNSTVPCRESHFACKLSVTLTCVTIIRDSELQARGSKRVLIQHLTKCLKAIPARVAKPSRNGCVATGPFALKVLPQHEIFSSERHLFSQHCERQAALHLPVNQPAFLSRKLNGETACRRLRQ